MCTNNRKKTRSQVLLSSCPKSLVLARGQARLFGVAGSNPPCSVRSWLSDSSIFVLVVLSPLAYNCCLLACIKRTDTQPSAHNGQRFARKFNSIWIKKHSTWNACSINKKKCTIWRDAQAVLTPARAGEPCGRKTLWEKDNCTNRQDRMATARCVHRQLSLF